MKRSFAICLCLIMLFATTSNAADDSNAPSNENISDEGKKYRNTFYIFMLHKTYLHILFIDIPRVKIKVFRGELKEENGETYAPWGYWIKQPSGK